MGINERLEKLLAEYCINQIPDLNPGVVIDIGSNIGEFSVALSRKIPNNFFIRFEPSITENMASLLNTSGIDGILIPRVLWSEEKVLEFFEANETGDSSLFPPKADAKSIHIQASSLDVQLRAFNLTQIELIKLEAEGAEPEILLGATKTLRITKYIVADLGPERGIEQESTYDAAIEILAKNNFELIGRNQLGRQCFLFRNLNLD